MKQSPKETPTNGHRRVNSSSGRRRSELTASKLRSAVTNGTKLFVRGDGNTAWARRYKDLIAGHVADRGGPDQLSGAQISLIKRASAIELELEQCEGRLSMSLPIDLDQYTRAAGHLRRLLESLGMNRKARDVTPVQDGISPDIKAMLKRAKNGSSRESYGL